MKKYINLPSIAFLMFLASTLSCISKNLKKTEKFEELTSSKYDLPNSSLESNQGYLNFIEPYKQDPNFFNTSYI